MKISLVKGWRTWWRQWSTWLAAIGAAVLNFAHQLAEALNYAWNLTPIDIRATFHPEAVQWFGFAITVLSIPAKLIRQRKLYEDVHARDDDRLGTEGQPDIPEPDRLDS